MPVGCESLPRFWSISPGLMSFLEEALVSTEKLSNPSEVQSEPHLPSDVVLGQLVTEWIGLENGIVNSPVILKLTTEGGQVLFTHGWFLEPTPSAPQRWEHCRWWLIQILNSVSLSSPLWTCIVAGNQPVAVYHLTHSLTSPFRQVQCFNTVYKSQPLLVSVYDFTWLSFSARRIYN